MEADYWGSEPWNLSPPGCIYCPTCPFDYPFDYSPNYRYFWNTIADGAACNSYDYCVCRCVRQPPPPPVPPLAPPHSPGENVFVRFTSGTDCAANGCSPLLEAECVGAYSSNLESYDFSGDKPQYTPGSWSGRPPGCYVFEEVREEVFLCITTGTWPVQARAAALRSACAGAWRRLHRCRRRSRHRSHPRCRPRRRRRRRGLRYCRRRRRGRRRRRMHLARPRSSASAQARAAPLTDAASSGRRRNAELHSRLRLMSTFSHSPNRRMRWSIRFGTLHMVRHGKPGMVAIRRGRCAACIRPVACAARDADQVKAFPRCIFGTRAVATSTTTPLSATMNAATTPIAYAGARCRRRSRRRRRRRKLCSCASALVRIARITDASPSGLLRSASLLLTQSAVNATNATDAAISNT